MTEDRGSRLSHCQSALGCVLGALDGLLHLRSNLGRERSSGLIENEGLRYILQENIFWNARGIGARSRFACATGGGVNPGLEAFLLLVLGQRVLKQVGFDIRLCEPFLRPERLKPITIANWKTCQRNPYCRAPHRRA